MTKKTIRMKNYLILASILLFFTQGFSQKMWTWEELAPMPEKTSNNAVVEGDVSGEKYVYSFGGIGETKSSSTIHNRSYRMKVSNNVWEQIPDLPGTPRKIAMGASYVKGKIYVMGGYSVSSKGAEKSYDSVHIYDPILNDFIKQGMPIPTPIDDHVQAVWRDSLIILVTGWSNTQNVPDVMLYDPTFDSWQIGTSVPSNTTYQSFGASGSIVGDTIYYHGGASMGGSFPAQSYLRKGVIDPLDPTNITWTQEEDSPGEALYRSAAVNYQNRVMWIGGSPISYNYNGIAYNGTGGVEPTTRILSFFADEKKWEEYLYQDEELMDLRGIAQLSETTWVTCGGMLAGQTVTDKVFKLTFDPNGTQNNPPVSVEKNDRVKNYIYPTLIDDVARVSNIKGLIKIETFDYLGREVKIPFEKNVLNFTSVSKGTYFINLHYEDGSVVPQKVVSK